MGKHTPCSRAGQVGGHLELCDSLAHPSSWNGNRIPRHELPVSLATTETLGRREPLESLLCSPPSPLEEPQLHLKPQKGSSRGRGAGRRWPQLGGRGMVE